MILGTWSIYFSKKDFLSAQKSGKSNDKCVYYEDIGFEKRARIPPVGEQIRVFFNLDTMANRDKCYGDEFFQAIERQENFLCEVLKINSIYDISENNVITLDWIDLDLLLIEPKLKLKDINFSKVEKLSESKLDSL